MTQSNKASYLLVAVFFLLASTLTSTVGGESSDGPSPRVNVQDFDSVDTNFDRAISFAEFEKWYRDQHFSTPNAGDRKARTLFHSHDIDANGQLSVDEFVPLAFALSRKSLQEEEKNLFKRLDLNTDGVLSKEELKTAETSLSQAFVHGLLSVADRNHDGQIALAEYEQEAGNFNGDGASRNRNASGPVTDSRGMAQSLIVSLDSNKDGVLQQQEIADFAEKFAETKVGPSTVHEVFQQVDANGDGKLTQEELEKRHDKLVALLGIRLEVPTIVKA